MAASFWSLVFFFRFIPFLGFPLELLRPFDFGGMEALCGVHGEKRNGMQTVAVQQDIKTRLTHKTSKVDLIFSKTGGKCPDGVEAQPKLTV